MKIIKYAIRLKNLQYQILRHFNKILYIYLGRRRHLLKLQ